MRNPADELVGPVENLLEIVSSVSQEPLCLLTIEQEARGRRNFRFTWVNDAFTELLNVPEERLLGMTFFDLLPRGGQLYEVLDSVAATGMPRSGETDVHPIVAPSTRIRYRVVHTPHGLAVSVSDRSAERHAQERASWLEQLLITGVELSAVSAAILRPIRSADQTIVDFSVEHLNQIACLQLGRDRDQLVGATLSQFLKQAPRNGGLIERIALAVEAGSPTVFETQLQGARVGFEWLRCHVVPLSDIVVVHIDDISERRTAERVLAASEQRYRSLFETANEGIALHDLNGRFTFINEAFATMLSTTPDALVGRSALEVVANSERQRSISDAESARRGDEPRVQRQMLMKRADGSEFWVFVSTNMTRDVNGDVDGFLVMALDIDQRIQAENALRSSEARYRAVVENADVLIALTDASGTLVYANELLVDTLGWPRSELVGQPATMLYTDEDRDRVAQGLRMLINGEIESGQSRNSIQRRDGRSIPTVGSAVALRDPQGNCEGLVIVGADISQLVEKENARRDLAAALAVAEQNERERLASDLHDGPVQTLTALSMRLGAAGVAHAHDPVVERILSAAEEAVTTTIGELRMLMFQLTPPDLDSERLGHCLLDRARKILGPTVQVTLHDEIRGFVDEPATKTLFRIAQEAIVNAAKHARADEVTLSLSETRTSFIVEVEDNGVGGNPAAFTKHAAGHLGVRGMTDRARTLGGVCDITSAPGQGTSVFIRIPRSPVHADGPTSSPSTIGRDDEPDEQ
jgi:PAS domain S-box-containing protein